MFVSNLSLASNLSLIFVFSNSRVGSVLEKYRHFQSLIPLNLRRNRWHFVIAFFSSGDPRNPDVLNALHDRTSCVQVDCNTSSMLFLVHYWRESVRHKLQTSPSSCLARWENKGMEILQKIWGKIRHIFSSYFYPACG